MSDLKFVAQFPIEDESMKLIEFHEQAKEETTLMIHQLGFGTAGPFWIELLDMPLATYVQCTVAVQPLNFPGVE